MQSSDGKSPKKTSSYHRLKLALEATKTALSDKTELAEEYLSKLQWLQAEFENYRKRAEKEKAQYIEYANEQLHLKLLPMLDDIECIVNTPSNDAKTLSEGINMWYKGFRDVLRSMGLTDMKTLGEKFDPYKHEAVMSVVNDDKPEDTIVEELQKGYLLHSKVIRPPKVKINVSRR